MTDPIDTSLAPAPLADLARLAAGPADRNPARVYLAGLAPGSVAAQSSALGLIASMVLPGTDLDTFPWARLRYQHTAAIRARLAALHAPATANRMLCALRRALKEAWRLGLMTAEDYHRARDVGVVQGTRLPGGRMLTHVELAALAGACDPATPQGARDAAILAVLFGGGLRRHEIAGLDLRDLQGAAVRFTGKRNKERLVPLPDWAIARLDAWLVFRGAGPGRLFRRVLTGKVCPTGISGKAVLEVLARLAHESGVAAFTPHDLRRTCISTLLDAGADLATVSQLVGHDDPKTTGTYDRRGEAARRRAVGMLRSPWGDPPPPADPAPGATPIDPGDEPAPGPR